MRLKLDLRTTVIFFAVAVPILLCGILTWHSNSMQATILYTELEKRGYSLSGNLASNIVLDMLMEDKKSLKDIAKHTAEQTDVAYVAILDARGKILSQSGNRAIIQKRIGKIDLFSKEITMNRLTEELLEFSAPIVSERFTTATETEKIISGEIKRPEVEKEQVKKIGWILLGLSTKNIALQSAALTRDNILLMLVVSAISLVIIIYIFALRLINPINELIRGTFIIAQGNLDFRVPVKFADEIGDLTISFNQMTDRLKMANEQIKGYSQTLEQRVEERTKQLKDAQAQTLQSAKMAAVGQLGAGIAHELNNPLGGILGYAQFILEKFKRPEFGIEDLKACQRYIESIEREAARCKGIVENLLKFSRKPISTKPEPVDIAKAIEETLSIIGHQLKLKNINVIKDLKPDLYKVMGMVNQLQQVFTNLILNAQQAMSDGGELRISAENITDEKAKATSYVKIEFADTGCGIPKENLQRIFDPFFTTKQKERGTGLGLTVSYQIIQDHEGIISVDSRVGKGSIFTVVLPVINKEGIV